MMEIFDQDRQMMADVDVYLHHHRFAHRCPSEFEYDHLHCGKHAQTAIQWLKRLPEVQHYPVEIVEY